MHQIIKYVTQARKNVTIFIESVDGWRIGDERGFHATLEDENFRRYYVGKVGVHVDAETPFEAQQIIYQRAVTFAESLEPQKQTTLDITDWK